MASKTPDPRKPLKTALELAEERAAAATKVSEVSQGLVPETAPVDPVVQGAGKMTQHVEGAPATSAAAAEAAAAKPGLFKRAVQTLTPSKGTVALIGANAADMVIPRADDSTDAGYNVNTARDTAMSALNTASLVPLLLRTKNPYAIGGAALLGGGMALHNRLKDYNAQHPENDAAPLQLPNASPNFWSQAPAAIHDAGHLASQALRGLGDGINYDIEHYTPYPYVRDAIQGGAQKAVDYFTPPKNTKFEGGAKILREATQGPVSQMNPDDLHEVVNSLPPNVKQEDDGSYTKSIYDDRGNYIGYGNSRTPYAAEAEKVLKQDLGPQAQAIYERLKAGYAQNSSSKPSVMGVSPSGEVVQTNYDEDGRILRSPNPEVQRLVDERLRDRAQQAVAAMPEFEAGSLERYNRFRGGVEAKRAFEAVQGAGVSQDPIVNARTARIMADSAERLGKATGQDPATLIPAADPRFSNPVEDTAREILQRKAQNLGGMSQSEAVANALIAAPNQYRSPIQDEAQKNAIQAFAPAERVNEAQAQNEDRDLARMQVNENARLQRESTEQTRQDAIAAGQERTKATLISRQLTSIQQQISKLSPNPSAAKMNAPRIAELQAQYKEMAKMDTTGIFGGEDVDSESDSGDITPQPTNAPTKESMKPGQTVVGKDGKTYRWTGTGFVPA